MVEYLQPPGGGDEVVLVPYDESWPARYTEQESRIRRALGSVALEVHHAGSTSVPGMTAKPVVDILLVVPDATDEAAYAPALQGAGFSFSLREPEWHEHRLFREEQPRVNLHVFGAACTEVARMLAFRDHLRNDHLDRELYRSTKLRLAARDWERVQDYADAKSEVVLDIMGRALPV
jgi:GrpB-like predicted nucleotidyltransferase (UPF0157 family)